MIRIVCLSGKLYGKENIDLNDIFDVVDIETFISEAEPVLLVSNLEDAEMFGIDISEIIMDQA
jgi:hypothetical protein